MLSLAVEIGSNGGLLSLQISEDFFKRSLTRLSTPDGAGGFIGCRLCRRPLENLWPKWIAETGSQARGRQGPGRRRAGGRQGARRGAGQGEEEVGRRLGVKKEMRIFTFGAKKCKKEW